MFETNETDTFKFPTERKFRKDRYSNGQEFEVHYDFIIDKCRKIVSDSIKWDGTVSTEDELHDRELTLFKTCQAELSNIVNVINQNCAVTCEFNEYCVYGCKYFAHRCEVKYF